MQQDMLAHLDDQDTGRGFDAAIGWMLVSLLAFMPLALGAVEAWSQLIVVVVSAALCLTVAAKYIAFPSLRPTRSAALLLALCFLGLILLQLMPLWAGLVRLLSPQTAAIKVALLQDAPGADTFLRRLTLTFYPWATRRDLRVLLCVVAVFAVTLQIFRRPTRIKWLLAAICSIGAAVALLALAQDLTGADKIFWVLPTQLPRATAGPFIFYSHFSQFMELSIGAGLGLLLLRIRELFGRDGATLPDLWTARAEPAMRLVWALAAFIVLGAISIFLSFSRGGMIAMLSAAVFTTAILTLTRRGGGRGWLATMLVLVTFVVLLYLGFDAVYERLATLGHFEKSQGGRIEMLHDLTTLFRKFPLFGTGLGTHEVVYPAYDHSTISAVATHAENEYAQLLEETGWVGAALALAFLALVWRSFTVSVRSKTAICSAAVGLGFGLFAIMVHSLSDFGQHLPANACLTAVFCALLINIARLAGKQPETESSPSHSTASQATPSRPTPSPRRAFSLSRPLWITAGVAMLAIWAWAVVGAENNRAAQSAWRQATELHASLATAQAVPDAAPATDEQYAELLVPATRAGTLDPSNIEYRYWLDVYRWESVSRERDPETNRIVLDDIAVGFARRIVDDLHEGRRLCPTFGPPYSVAGQIEWQVLEDPVGADHIRTGFTLAPTDATACYVAGTLDAADGQWDAAESKFRRSVALDGGYFQSVATFCVFQADHPDVPLKLAAGDSGRLVNVADLLDTAQKEPALAAQARADAVELLRARCDGPNPDAGSLAAMASLCQQKKDYAAAAGYYRRAVGLEYGQVDWRFHLAEVLQLAGDNRAALHEARICLRLRPEWQAARQFVATLSVLPGVNTSESSDAAPPVTPTAPGAPSDVHPSDVPAAAPAGTPSGVSSVRPAAAPVSAAESVTTAPLSATGVGSKP